MIDQKDFWGPKLWKLMHTITYFAPEELTNLQRSKEHILLFFLG